MPEHLCKECEFFHELASEDKKRIWLGQQYGECHAHPPVFHRKASWKWQNEWAFPVVDGNNPDTCMDYK